VSANAFQRRMLARRRGGAVVLKFVYLLRFSDRIDSMAWKTHTEISSSNHNRETTFSHVKKRFIQSEISCQNESVSSQRVHVVVGTILGPLQSSFREFFEFSQVYTSFLAN